MSELTKRQKEERLELIKASARRLRRQRREEQFEFVEVEDRHQRWGYTEELEELSKEFLCDFKWS